MLPLSIAQGTLIAIGLVAAWLDARTRRLPNWLSLLALAAGLAVTAVNTGIPALGSHLLHAAIALVVGMGLFRLGLIGGGDAKFYTGIAAWFSLHEAPRLLLYVSLSGLALFIVWFFWRRLTGKKIVRRAGDDDGKFPYGVAIAAGSILAIFGPI